MRTPGWKSTLAFIVLNKYSFKLYLRHNNPGAV